MAGGVEKSNGGMEQEGVEESTWCEVELPLGFGEAADAEPFDLEKAVCNHGFFMMSPNRWDPQSKTLLRPLRLQFHDDSDDDDDASSSSSSSSSSVMVRISHPPHLPNSRLLRVYGVTCLSPTHEQALLAQVSRMLHLSETEVTKFREFRKIFSPSPYLTSFSGRVFRSPTLFEDMVKCILLCNCQWPRTLSMAKSLCELQLELQSWSKTKAADFVPSTPAPKESKRKFPCFVSTSLPMPRIQDKTDSCFSPATSSMVANFPSPRELANLDESFLATRCKLGYRASCILKLAKGIVEGRIQLGLFEDICRGASLSGYNDLAYQLRQIDGFGPFTCANVLVCVGFYHVIPTDSETVRHLKQVHSRNTTVQTVQQAVEDIYGKYSPFQFLAYWAELWHFYEQRFGKLSEMSYSDYKLITASNMKTKRTPKTKKIERCLDAPIVNEINMESDVEGDHP